MRHVPHLRLVIKMEVGFFLIEAGCDPLSGHEQAGLIG